MVNVARKIGQKILCQEELFDGDLGSYSTQEPKLSLPCSASIRILVGLLVVVLSPSPAVSRISSWLSTLYQDPPPSVEKRESSL